MSMDLGRLDFSIEPKYFIAGTTIGIKTDVFKTDEAIPAHAPVNLEDGLIKKVTSAEDLTKLYGITADSVEAGKEIPVYLSGEFFADGLALEAGVTADKLEEAFRKLGIYLVGVEKPDP